MKAIIFDIDNTLINWCDEFVSVLRNILKDYKINDEKLVLSINNCLDNHRLYFKKLTKQNMLDYINKNNNIKLPIEFINRLIDEQKNLYYKDDSINNTLEYLSKKYDLYIMTDWFTETQIGRLKNMGILKYFKEVYGADINYYKNNAKAYDIILKKYNKSDCLFVGDNLDLDIKKPISLGMNAIWKTNEKNNKYKIIKEIEELKEML